LQAVAVNIRSESVAEICDLLIAKMGVAQAREDDVVILVIRYDPASGGTAPLTTVNRQAPREAAATGSSGSAGVGG
jgi:hypothetical protein